MIDRLWISHQFIRGTGIEIGAFHNPWPLHQPTSVLYVDKADPRTVLARHPDLNPNTKCVTPDIIDDGEQLDTMGFRQWDFVIASHVLEHYFSPLTGIANHLRVVKEGGTLIYALPNKQHTFDRKRPNSHRQILQEYYTSVFTPEGRLNEQIRLHHEYLFYVDGITDLDERVRIARDRLSKGMDIHYHCWDAQGIYELFQLAHDCICHDLLDFEVVLFYPSGHEVFIVLRRTK